MPDIRIGPATDDECEWCALLMASSDPWLRLGRGLEECRLRCRHPEYLLRVARRLDAPVGFTLLHPRGMAGAPYLASIAVSPAARGQGTGALLMADAEAQFPAARHIFLCVSSFNPRARDLYLRLGYERVGELKDYVVAGASEVILHKRLDRP